MVGLRGKGEDRKNRESGRQATGNVPEDQQHRNSPGNERFAHARKRTLFIAVSVFPCFASASTLIHTTSRPLSASQLRWPVQQCQILCKASRSNYSIGIPAASARQTGKSVCRLPGCDALWWTRMKCGCAIAQAAAYRWRLHTLVPVAIVPGCTPLCCVCWIISRKNLRPTRPNFAIWRNGDDSEQLRVSFLFSLSERIICTLFPCSVQTQLVCFCVASDADRRRSNK